LKVKKNSPVFPLATKEHCFLLNRAPETQLQFSTVGKKPWEKEKRGEEREKERKQARQGGREGGREG
jgi:hypothetical protein